MDTCFNCGTHMSWNPSRKKFWCPTCRNHHNVLVPSEGEIALACARIQETWGDGREQVRSGGARRLLEVTRELRVGDHRKRKRHE